MRLGARFKGRRSRRWEFTASGLLALAFIAACGSDKGPTDDETDADGPGQASVEDQNLIDTDDDDDEGAPGLPNECLRESFDGERVAVNLHLLVDISGSMDIPISATATRWDAVRDAITEFINSSDSAGLNLALSFYPQQTPRKLCTSHADCDGGAPCHTNVCVGELLFVAPIYCEPDRFDHDAETCVVATVALDEETVVGVHVDNLTPQDEIILEPELCLPPGRCEDAPTELCLIDEQCPSGVCLETDQSICPGINSCDVADYNTPSVPITGLPGGAMALIDALSGIKPDPFALTPTHIGLQGAFEHSASWVDADPNAKSFVVLATDGFPEGCAGVDAAGNTYEPPELTLEELGRGSAAGIDTFVIGVVDDQFDTNGEGRAALAEMAQAGGTDEALIVTADDTTADGFLAALDAIRGQVLPCEYKIPKPDEGVTDLQLVNVEVQRDGETVIAPQVDGPSACVEGQLGWHYDQSLDEAPSTIVLCPQTCEELSGSAGTQLDVVLGCKTVRQVK